MDGHFRGELPQHHRRKRRARVCPAALPPERESMSSHRPGEVVRQSGLYRVDGCPVCPREMALLEGERFPSCSACQVRQYLLAVAAEPIENDPDFR
jgi:hypothetical protein